MAILVQVGGKILAICVLGVEMVVYLVYKVVRDTSGIGCHYRKGPVWLPVFLSA